MLRRGQGLLEVIIAFAIVGIGLGASLTLLLTSGVENRRTELRSIAANLAREGVEVIRSVRDSNWLAGNAFDSGLYDGVQANMDAVDGISEFDPATGGWKLNFVSNPPADFSGADDTVYIVNSLFRQKAGVVLGAKSPFERFMVVRSICSAGLPAETIVDGSNCTGFLGTSKIGVAVTVRVRWTDRGKTFNYILEERLYDWKL